VATLPGNPPQMGPHNRFPSYFYERGNLFNTYLGSADDRGRPPVRKASPGTRMARFAESHMDSVDVERLLNLLAREAGVAVRGREAISSRLPTQLGRFVDDHIPQERAEFYLGILKGRHERGEALVQK